MHQAEEMWASVCLLTCFKLPLVFSNMVWFCSYLGDGTKDLCMLGRWSATELYSKILVLPFFNNV